MLAGKELILATKPYAKEDRAKSWRYTLTTIFLLCVTYFGALYPFPLVIRIICSLLATLILLRMFIIYHDYLHRSILQKSPLANLIFTIFGLYILAPKSIWQRSHDYHHAHNSKLYSSSIGSFPIVTKKKYLESSKGERAMYLFIRHPLTIMLGYLFAFIWGMCMLSFLRSPSKHWDSALSLIFHFSIGALVYNYLGGTAFLLGFLVPSALSSTIGAYLFFAQHNFPGVTFKTKEEWTYIDAALESSSYMTMSPLMHWFTGNIGYHHIHHTNARIPFYRLPEVFKAFPEFQKAKRTSLNPKDIAACLRLKVWDPTVGRMLTGSELKAIA